MYQIVEFSHLLIKEFLTSLTKENIIAVDATLGNGSDALFIAQLLTNKGLIVGYDIQEQSIVNTSKKLATLSLNNLILKLQSHENIEEENIDLLVFNLGYLPNGDKTITTKAPTTLNALKKALPKMNSHKMLIIICVYVGHSEGLEEHLVLDKFVKDLPKSQYLVCKYQNYNHESSPYLITISYH